LHLFAVESCGFHRHINYLDVRQQTVVNKKKRSSFSFSGDRQDLVSLNIFIHQENPVATKKKKKKNQQT